MSNLLRNSFKICFRNKSNYLWNFLFPLVYLLIYVMAISNFSSPEGDNTKIDTIKLAILPVSEQSSSAQVESLDLSSFFTYMGDKAIKAEPSTESLAQENEEALIIYTEVSSIEEGENLLRKGEIYALIIDGAEPELRLLQNEKKISQMVLSEIMRAYQQTRSNVSALEETALNGKLDLRQIVQIRESMSRPQNFEVDKSQRQTALPMILIYYFSMMAYLAFFPVFSGSIAIDQVEPNKSYEAIRDAIAPLPKWQRVIASLTPIIVVQFVSISFFYSIVRLLDVGLTAAHWKYLLVLYCTTLAAIFLGAAMGTLLSSAKTGLKNAVSIALPLFFAFCSGMMSENIPTLIKQKAPWLNVLNPVAHASQSFYALEGGLDISEYYQELYYIAIFALICFIVMLIGLRRDSYESL